MGARFERTRRALQVMRVARRSGGRRVLAELGVLGRREATREGLLPDVYIEELGRLVDGLLPRLPPRVWRIALTPGEL